MAQKSSRGNTNTTGQSFTDDERAAMRERALELKANKHDGEGAVRAKIAEMPAADRVLAERIHALVREHAPELVPRTWYGMPAYANKEGRVVCFFQGAAKFKSRYATLGFSDTAHLDEGDMWPTAFALRKLTPADEEKIINLVKRACDT